MTDNARAEFEKWWQSKIDATYFYQTKNTGYSKYRGADLSVCQELFSEGWQARDAALREKLASEEMVERCAIAAENAKVERIIEEQKLHQQAGGDIVVAHERIAFRKTGKTIARAVLAAILEEMK